MKQPEWEKTLESFEPEWYQDMTIMKAFIRKTIKQEMGRVIGEDEVEFKVNGKQKLEYKASDSYYNPVRNQLKAQQRRKAGIK